jgi:hypothetical protein
MFLFSLGVFDVGCLVNVSRAVVDQDVPRIFFQVEVTKGLQRIQVKFPNPNF